MRLLIDALSARQGGGQTYLYNLLSAFPESADDEIFILVPPSFRFPVERSNLHRVEPGWNGENPFARAVWERFALPRLIRELRADVLFCPGGIIPTRAPEGCCTVTMFRNMIPFDLVQRARYPLGYTRLRNFLLERLLLRSMLAADLVIFISGYAREVIEARAPGRIRRFAVIPHGVAARFRADGPVAARPAWLPSGDYLLYVSSLDKYKAQLQVVQAYARLCARRPTPEKLVLAGPVNNAGYAKALRREIARLGLEREVMLAGPIPYAELPAVYRHARLQIFASESENCPNILLEAMASGRPVLSSRLPPMPEFGGDAVEYFDPRDPENLAAHLHALLDSPERMAALAEAGQHRVLAYDWNETARRTREALAALAGRKGLGLAW